MFPLFLSLNVERILGFSQSMVPLQWRACLDMPDMFSSALLEVTSFLCCPIRVLKLTRVCPIYLASGLQLHVCW